MEKLNGFYYRFDCMNAFYSDKLFSAGAFKSEKEAIQKAADLEAELFRYEYDASGACVDYECIYNPWN